MSQCSFDKNPNVYCHFTLKPSYLKKKMNKLRAFLNGDLPKWYSKLLSDNNGKYYMKDASFPIQIEHYVENRDAIKEFDEIIQKILNFDFAHSIYHKFNTKFSGISYQLETAPSDINFFGTINVMNLDRSCDYTVCFDTINIMNYNANLSNDFINETFNVQFPKEIIPTYHQRLIDNNDVSDKKIIIADDISKSAMVDFSVEEDEKEIILTKSNIRKENGFF